jgi:hypothetical protein
MKAFLLAIHRDPTTKKPVPTPEQMQAAIKPYGKLQSNFSFCRKRR